MAVTLVHRKAIAAARAQEPPSGTRTVPSTASASSSSNQQTTSGMRVRDRIPNFFVRQASCCGVILLSTAPQKVRRWCMPARFLPLLGVLLLAFAVGLPGQKNHNLNWKTGASPNVFDTLEKQGNNSRQLSHGKQQALHRQREAKIAN